MLPVFTESHKALVYKRGPCTQGGRELWFSPWPEAHSQGCGEESEGTAKRPSPRHPLPSLLHAGEHFSALWSPCLQVPQLALWESSGCAVYTAGIGCSGSELTASIQKGLPHSRLGKTLDGLLHGFWAAEVGWLLMYPGNLNGMWKCFISPELVQASACCRGSTMLQNFLLRALWLVPLEANVRLLGSRNCTQPVRAM